VSKPSRAKSALINSVLILMALYVLWSVVNGDLTVDERGLLWLNQ
jgi:hypothetical protein